MSNTEAMTGRELLQAAHIESQNGLNVVVHIEGVSPLLLREIEAISSDANCATVRTWADGELPAATWIISLASVRAIEFPDCAGR